MTAPPRSELRHRPLEHVGAAIVRWRCRLAVTVRSDESTRPTCERVLLTSAERLERAASRFRTDSELAAVNRADGAWVDISPTLATVLAAALTAARRTGGLVDPCVGRAVDAAGYRWWRSGEPAPPGGRFELRYPLIQEQACWRRVELRRAGRRRQVRVPGCCQLDLGAIAKAWLADRIAERLADQGLDVVADMGGDIRAIGRSRAWSVAAEPELPPHQPVVLGVGDAGLATSGQGRRRWVTPSGTVAHHLIDPRTGRPAATPWWSASVLAADAVAANTAATAAMVLGRDAPNWIAANGLDAWLVPAPGAQEREQRLGRWPAASSSGDHGPDTRGTHDDA